MAWYPPGAGVQLIIAMGASVVNTNQNINHLGQTIVTAQQEQAGYRHLKPKKDVTKVTCDGAEELLVEMVQFEVDLGELGININSEAAYRQLKAAVQGKAREVLDLEQVRGGPISQLLFNLDAAVNAGAPKQTRDAIGGELYRQCCAALCVAVP